MNPLYFTIVDTQYARISYIIRDIQCDVFNELGYKAPMILFIATA